MSIQRLRVHGRRMMLALLALGIALAASQVQAAKPIPPAGPPVKYTATPVPLDNVLGMNNLGDMVDGGAGLYDHFTGDVYDLSTPINALLATADGEVLTNVVDINDSWQVAGAFRGSNGVLHAFRCSIGVAGGTVTATALEKLPEPAGYPWGLPAAINNPGDVVGQVENSDNPPGEWRAVLWPAEGGVQQLASVFSAAFDVSDTGKVSGFMYTSPQQHAFLYDPSSGKTSDLGTLPRYPQSFGYAVNNSGQVAGRCYGGGRPVHAFRYTPGVGMVDLGSLAGDSASQASSINSAAHVVGLSIKDVSKQRGFLYTDANKMLDLTTLITNAPAGFSFRPEAVNDYDVVTGSPYKFGQIAGTAYVNGVFAGVFLLTPDR